MIYNPKSDHELNKARKRFEQLITKGKPFELKEITKRSLKSNSFLHVLLSYLALELGYTLAYVKLNIWKMKWNRYLFYVDTVNEKTGHIYKTVRSSADLNNEELSHAIGVLIEKAFSECGVIFPDKNSDTYDDDLLLMQREVFNNQKYL
jgi:hypothetical protein